MVCFVDRDDLFYLVFRHKSVNVNDYHRRCDHRGCFSQRLILLATVDYCEPFSTPPYSLETKWAFAYSHVRISLRFVIQNSYFIRRSCCAGHRHAIVKQLEQRQRLKAGGNSKYTCARNNSEISHFSLCPGRLQSN